MWKWKEFFFCIITNRDLQVLSSACVPYAGGKRNMAAVGLYRPMAAAAAASETIVMAITVVCVLCLIVHSAD